MKMAAAETNSNSGMVTLEPESISTIHVQTDPAEAVRVRRTLHLSGQIVGNSSTAAWFEFTAYERDLPWLKVGQTFDVNVPSAPGKIYHGANQITRHKAVCGREFRHDDGQHDNARGNFQSAG